ncbi:MAG: 3'(2'),5'-bisphosphate nucleotidase [Actinobacteria bacterium]|nr:3'(2'),5'-bisphosphate nucleotidase [Actinomycetota bacterium]
MTPALEDILAVARGAARAASIVCLGVLEEAPATPEAMAKLGKEPVTVADYGSQAVILQAVASSFPEHGVIAEEGAAHFSAHAAAAGAEQMVRLVGRALGRAVTLDQVLGWIDHRGGTGPYTWVIDPIDGTKGFLRREQFAVAVGLLYEGEPVAGVLACPHLPLDLSDAASPRGLLFWGERGLGAFAEGLEGGPARPVTASGVDAAGEVRVLGSVESAHGDPALVQAVIERAGLGGGWVRLDSQVKYGAVASGMAEVYLRPRSRPDYRDCVWDHAAGTAIVEAAGGRVSDLDGRPLDFSLGARLEANRGVLVSNGRVHGLVLEALAAAGR